MEESMQVGRDEGKQPITKILAAKELREQEGKNGANKHLRRLKNMQVYC